jgi:hypothetical protein
MTLRTAALCFTQLFGKPSVWRTRLYLPPGAATSGRVREGNAQTARLELCKQKCERIGKEMGWDEEMVSNLNKDFA